MFIINELIDFLANSVFGQLLSFISVIFTIATTLVALIHYFHSIKNFSWRKVKKGILCLKNMVQEIDPDIIIALSGRGGIVVNLLINELNNKYPVYTCILKSKLQKEFSDPVGWEKVSTSKWQIFIYPEILKMIDKRILIVDDISSSGETILSIRNILEQKGIPSDNIFSMALVSDKETHKNRHIPDYYWKMVNIDEYNVPWGKTIINNHK